MTFNTMWREHKAVTDHYLLHLISTHSTPDSVRLPTSIARNGDAENLWSSIVRGDAAISELSSTRMPQELDVFRAYRFEDNGAILYQYAYVGSKPNILIGDGVEILGSVAQGEQLSGFVKGSSVEVKGDVRFSTANQSIEILQVEETTPNFDYTLTATFEKREDYPITIVRVDTKTSWDGNVSSSLWNFEYLGFLNLMNPPKLVA